MWKRYSFHVSIVLFLLVLVTAEYHDSCLEDVETETKLQMVKDSLNKVKNLIPKCRDADEDLSKCSRRDTALAHLKLALDTLKGFVEGDTKICPKCPDPIVTHKAVDCSDVLSMGYTSSGVYTIYPRSGRSIKVYCDMNTDGGGWIVIQRRGNYSTQTDFHRDWETYKNGFGNVARDFWLGNQYIYELTSQGEYSLRIDMRSNITEYKYSLHDIFSIGNEESGYVLNIQDFSGNVSNDLETQNKVPFSTKDRQNNGRSQSESCTGMYYGAWWYPGSNCGTVNLNGMYMPGIGNRNSNWWWNWTGYQGLYFSEMKIRLRNRK